MWLFKKDKSREPSNGNNASSSPSETPPETPPDFMPRNLDEEQARSPNLSSESPERPEHADGADHTNSNFDAGHSVISDEAIALSMGSATRESLHNESDSFTIDSIVENVDGNRGELGTKRTDSGAVECKIQGVVGSGNAVDSGAGITSSGVSNSESGVGARQSPIAVRNVVVGVQPGPIVLPESPLPATIPPHQQHRLEPALAAFPDLEPGKQQEFHEFTSPSPTTPERTFAVAVKSDPETPEDLQNHRLSTQTNPEFSTTERQLADSPNNHVFKEDSSPKSRRLHPGERLHTQTVGRARRSATESFVRTTKSKQGSPSQGRGRHRTTSSGYQSGRVEEALAAVEPAHERKPVKMGFAEQQKWITVQQKTFTKW